MLISEPKKITLPVSAKNEADEELAVLSSLKKTLDTVDLEGGNDGRLTVDVAETDIELVVIATMAGTPKEKVELHLHNDLLTIKGERSSPASSSATYHYHECYWGKFSRSIVLPADVRLDLARAEYKNGLLVVRLPKTKADQSIPVYIIEE